MIEYVNYHFYQVLCLLYIFHVCLLVGLQQTEYIVIADGSNSLSHLSHAQ